MFAFGSIVLTRFPFTDLSGDKRRPALMVSRDNDRRTDLVVCFITSVPRTGRNMAPLGPAPGTGLKVPSVVCFDKLATLDRAVIASKLGDAPADWLIAQSSLFSACSAFTARRRQALRCMRFTAAATLGLSLAEAKSVLAGLRRRLVQTQAEEHCRVRRHCPVCGEQRPLKDLRSRQLRSLFGTVEIRAPRLEPCQCEVTLRTILSPVKEIMTWFSSA